MAALESGTLRLLATLREALPPTAAGSPREALVTVLQPGTSRNGNHYPPAVVRSLAPLLEGAQAYADHAVGAAGPALRSIRDLVGYYTRPTIAPDGALHATLRLVEGDHVEWLWALIREAVRGQQEGLPPLVGLSIEALAETRPRTVGGRSVRAVESITRLLSCDVVARAAAGGTFDRLLSEAWGDEFQPTAALPDQVPLRAPGPRDAYGRAPSGGGLAAVDTPLVGPADQLTAPTALAGGWALAGRLIVEEGVLPMPTPAVTAPEGATADLHTLREQLESAHQVALADLAQQRQLLTCERLLDTTLREATLPTPARRRIQRAFAGRVFEQADLTAALDDEATYLADLATADGRSLVRGLGYEKTLTVGLSERDRLQKAFDQLFDVQEGERVPQLSGLREAYIMTTGDTGLTGFSSPDRMAQLVREADITTASFSYLLGTSMNKRLLKEYQAWPAEWQKFCAITPIKDFKQQDRIRTGAFGSLATVPEDTAYAYLTLSDTRAIYTPTKRGNLVAVTRETIVNDDLYSIRQIPTKLAVSAAFTLAEFIYQMLLNPTGPTIYDGHPLFDSVNHLNSAVPAATLATRNSGTALGSAAMQVGVTAMRKQTNLAGKPIGLKPRYLVVTPDLEFAAMQTVKSAGLPGTTANDINPMLGYAEVLVVPQLNGLASGTTTQWVLIADPRVIDTVEIGFVGGQVNPVLLVQDNPLFGNNFTNDVITYKVRHEYGGAVLDYRGFYLGNN